MRTKENKLWDLFVSRNDQSKKYSLVGKVYKDSELTYGDLYVGDGLLVNGDGETIEEELGDEVELEISKTFSNYVKEGKDKWDGTYYIGYWFDENTDEVEYKVFHENEVLCWFEYQEDGSLEIDCYEQLRIDGSIVLVSEDSILGTTHFYNVTYSTTLGGICEFLSDRNNLILGELGVLNLDSFGLLDMVTDEDSEIDGFRSFIEFLSECSFNEDLFEIDTI